VDIKAEARMHALHRRSEEINYKTEKLKCCNIKAGELAWGFAAHLPKTVLSSDSVAVFKSRLMTFLFSQAFSSFSAH